MAPSKDSRYDFSNGVLHEDNGNIQRLIILYRLRRNERLLEFIEALMHRNRQITGSGNQSNREAYFLRKLFSILQRYSTDKKHRDAAELPL